MTLLDCCRSRFYNPNKDPQCGCDKCWSMRNEFLRFQESLKEAQEIVKTWPEWKRNILGGDGK